MPHSWSRLAAEPRILAVTLVFLWFAILGVFYLNPEIDLAISRYFFDGVLCGNEPTTVSCGQFDLSQSVIAKAARSVFYQLPVIGGAIVLGVLVVLLVRRRRWDDTLQNLAMALASLGLGAGLVVNGLLKELSGRPRPSQIFEFGGDLPFMPAGTFSGQCTGNCSFVSGEAAGAGWMLCLIFLVPAQCRKWIVPPLLCVSLAPAALRVAVGAHFASDAILGWLLPLTLFATMKACLHFFRSILAGVHWDLTGPQRTSITGITFSPGFQHGRGLPMERMTKNTPAAAR